MIPKMIQIIKCLNAKTIRKVWYLRVRNLKMFGYKNKIWSEFKSNKDLREIKKKIALTLKCIDYKLMLLFRVFMQF
jgi:hypothetical protein